jgi:cysteine desulfuration protein SufE
MTLLDLPGQFADVVEEFTALSEPDRLQLLLEYSRGLPELPERLAGHRDRMEPVPECQAPVFLAVEVDGGTVHVFFDSPPESPTTRGFAGVLREGLDGLSVEEVLAVPDDVPLRLGLDRAVSPLRLRGMGAMLGRIKRQVRERSQDFPTSSGPRPTSSGDPRAGRAG